MPFDPEVGLTVPAKVLFNAIGSRIQNWVSCRFGARLSGAPMGTMQLPAACQNERRHITVKVSEGHGRPREHPEPDDPVSAGLTVWLPIEDIPSEIGQAALLTSDVELYAEVCPRKRPCMGRSCRRSAANVLPRVAVSVTGSMM